MEVLLHLLLAAQVGDEVVDAAVHLVHHLRVLDLDRVDARLVQEQFVNRHLLGDDAIGVAVDVLTLILQLQILLLDVALEDGLVAHHPGHLLGNIVLCHSG